MRKRALRWAAVFAALAILPPLTNSGPILVTSSIFSVWAAINLMWVLVWGTAGLFSLATMTVVGVGGYAAAFVSINYGVSWVVLPFVGILAGLVMGLLLGLPALRIKGVYFSLLTMGINEFLRVYVSQSKEMGSLQGGLYGVSSFIPEAMVNQREGFLVGHFVGLGLLALALVYHLWIDQGRLGLLLRTSRESESSAQVFGINVASTRMTVFILSSMALGLIGAFYASLFRSVSVNLFSLDTLLLLLAMMVIGGMNSPSGVILGTALVVFVDQILIDLGPNRMIGIAAVTLIITLTAENGLIGLPHQLRVWWAHRGRSRTLQDKAGADKTA